MTLNELQRRFRAALRETDAPPPALRAAKLDAADALDIYRNSVTLNWRNALADTYAVTYALVGQAFFNRLADGYATAHPSVSGDLNDFGEHFAAHVARDTHARELPYLTDIARLEWAVHRARLAADLPDDASRVMAEIASAYPIASIWNAHGADDVDAALAQIDIDDTPETACVLRRGLRVFVEATGLKAAP